MNENELLSNNKTLRNLLCYTILLLVIACGGIGIQTCRLEESRIELRQVRRELEAAADRQQSITDIVSRTGEILSESADTLQSVRKQIQEIRISYEDMARLLYRDDNSGGSIDSTSDNRAEK